MVMITNSFDKFPNEPTALMYEQFGKIGLNPSTVTFEDDFSTSPNGWTSVGSTVTISSGALRAVSVNTASDDRIHKGLGFTLSNSAWVCQFEVNLSTSNYTNLIALTDRVSNMNAYDTILCDYNGSNIKMREYNGSTLGLDSTGIAVSTGTQYYITLTRTGETGLKLDVRTGSHTGTVVGSQTGTISSGTVDLDTVQSGAYGRESGSASYVIDNLKIYNGVTSTTSPKVKQHFIEWFSGKQIPSYWTFTDIYETNSGAMVDEVGGGYKITTATGGGNPTCSISFNKSSSSGNSNSNVCQYNYKGSVFNTVMKVDSITSIEAKVGLKKNTSGNFNHSNATIFGSSTLTNWACFSGDESGRTAVESNIPLDTNWNNHKLTLQTSNILYDINGVLKVTKTDRLPTVENLQPQAQMVSLNTDAKSLSIRCMEVYNT